MTDYGVSLRTVTVCRVFGLGAQILVTMGLQREKAGRGSLAMYTQVRVDHSTPSTPSGFELSHRCSSIRPFSRPRHLIVVIRWIGRTVPLPHSTDVYEYRRDDHHHRRRALGRSESTPSSSSSPSTPRQPTSSPNRARISYPKLPLT